jgi:hypothetical protein
MKSPFDRFPGALINLMPNLGRTVEEKESEK